MEQTSLPSFPKAVHIQITSTTWDFTWQFNQIQLIASSIATALPASSQRMQVMLLGVIRILLESLEIHVLLI